MRTVPIENQIFPSDPLSDFIALVAAEEPFTNEQVLAAIEHVAGRPMPELLAELVLRAKFKGLKRSGHPIKFDAVHEFTLPRLDLYYRVLVRKYQREAAAQRKNARLRGEKLARGGHSSSERAYRWLCVRFKKEFGVIDWKSLRNIHTKWKKEALFRLEHETESFPFDEMLEQHFPAQKSSS